MDKLQAGIPPFCGVCTAMITPFHRGEIDFDSLRFLIERQIAAGIDAICIAGTTGEAATLSRAEWQHLLDESVKFVGGRMPVIAGVGTPSTDESRLRARLAKEAGADALLVVTPYYNRGTEDGIVRHFHRIADAGELPVILYNVPGRTGLDLTVALYTRIAAHPLICAVKEAGAGYERVQYLLEAMGDRLAVYTGSDEGILATAALGASGVVSVLSNLLPNEVKELTDAALSGDIKRARELQFLYLPLIRALFAETNPAPIKAALSLAGLSDEELRLPLAPISPDLRRHLAFLLGIE